MLLLLFKKFMKNMNEIISSLLKLAAAFLSALLKNKGAETRVPKPPQHLPEKDSVHEQADVPTETETASVKNPPPSEEVKTEKWRSPVPQKYFATPSQHYLQEDWELYGKFGHHTGTDYGGLRQEGIPLFACAEGEIVYRETANSAWGVFLGNHAALYVPSIDKTFLYCHMATEPPALGQVEAGAQIGVMGNTGKSSGGAIHLHLEGFHGRFQVLWRSFLSLEDIKTKTFDADSFIRSKIT